MTNVRMKPNEMQNGKWNRIVKLALFLPSSALVFVLIFVLSFVFNFGTLAHAQPTVLVNGVRLEQVDNTTVNGIDYVGVAELSDVIGATWSNTVDGQRLHLELAGQFLVLPIVNTVEEAVGPEQSLELRRSGTIKTVETLPSTSALPIGESLYVPLKSVVRALGGSADYVAEINSVIAVFERAKLSVLAYPQANSSGERFVLNLSVPVQHKIQDLQTLSVLNILFSQTSSQLSSRSITGRGFQNAVFRNFAGDVEFRLELRPGFKADIFTSPPAAGYSGVNVIVDILPNEAYAQRYQDTTSNNNGTVVSTIGSTNSIGITESLANEIQTTTVANPLTSTVISNIGANANVASATINVAETGEAVALTTRSSHIVLDPVPASDTKLMESDLSFDFVAGLASDLQRYGFSSSITRTKADLSTSEIRRNAGIGAAAFISISQANIPASTFNLYYLGEAESVETLDLAVRRNAQAALNSSNTQSENTQDKETAALRRKVLLNLSSSVAEAESLAESISRSLTAKGYQARNIQALPLYILGGSVGRGLVLELSVADLNNASVRTAVLEAILQLNLQ